MAFIKYEAMVEVIDWSWNQNFMIPHMQSYHICINWTNLAVCSSKLDWKSSIRFCLKYTCRHIIKVTYSSNINVYYDKAMNSKVTYVRFVGALASDWWRKQPLLHTLSISLSKAARRGCHPSFVGDRTTISTVWHIIKLCIWLCRGLEAEQKKSPKSSWVKYSKEHDEFRK